ncbi:MAG: hypothetical protein N4A44_03730 [Alphaproteobacteria bacterium]|nr:hypothetical protein [Alphaproteobacteria bacterium]
MGQFVMFVLDISLVVMSLLYLLVYRVDNDLLFEQYDYVSRYRSSGGFYLAKKDGDLIITDVDYQVVTSWEKLKDFRKHRRDACIFANRELPKPRVNSKFIKIYRIKLNDLLRA